MEKKINLFCDTTGPLAAGVAFIMDAAESPMTTMTTTDVAIVVIVDHHPLHAKHFAAETNYINPIV